jgi:hypothetical protein
MTASSAPTAPASIPAEPSDQALIPSSPPDAPGSSLPATSEHPRDPSPAATTGPADAPGASPEAAAAPPPPSLTASQRQDQKRVATYAEKFPVAPVFCILMLDSLLLK